MILESRSRPLDDDALVVGDVDGGRGFDVVTGVRGLVPPPNFSITATVSMTAVI